MSTTASFTGYAPGGFGEAEQLRLADLFRALDERGVGVLLSNHDTPLVRKLYAEYRRVPVKLTRAINSAAARRRTAVPEVIVCGHTIGDGLSGRARPEGGALARGRPAARRAASRRDR